ncbi:hypothetical protein MPH_03816 [Macrophomina phaseolina MS6]|uniref:Uncharacterized protein n=1 Tax=Macrophomina phaseolina (strain MS6) TaxID=1126212 RepID=K2S1S2_MACPH|nr:hypothetical protein MPH_03816 [Macrophomina phaseolina MS6]
MRGAFPKRSSRRTASFSGWRPTALGPPVLLAAIAVAIALIVTLQIFLERSQREGGLIFAPNVNDLPLGRSFCYLYLGTIISVLYSILWAWIDLDAKRLEPFHQLSKAQGSTGQDSLLLHYPFDFIASVPIKAIMRRHWPVFWASLCVVLVFWGVTPFQAGIFATETIKKQLPEKVLVSTGFLPVSQQRTEMTANFTYSAFGITWLNETLPPFMTPQYVLAPFKLERNSSGVAYSSENVTANTRLYSVDIKCENATIFTPKNESEVMDFPSLAPSYYISTTGCRVPRPYGPTGNDTMGGVGVEEVKKYTSLYAGYNDDNGYANYYMSSYCPRNISRTFFAAFTENKAKESDPPKTPTVLFCNSTYYYQEVRATVGVPDNNVIDMTALGEATEIPEGMFNVTDLEWQMNSQRQEHYVRGEIPGSVWPDQTEMLSTKDISLRIEGSILPLMSGLAIGAWKNTSYELLLEPEYLRQSYQAAYRILFARMMYEALDQNFTRTETVSGMREYRTQAVVMVPAYTYLVEALLGALIVVCSVLLCISTLKPRKLRSDPASLAAVMSLVADDDALLRKFSHLDYSKEEDMTKALEKERFRLAMDGGRSMLRMHTSTDDVPSLEDETRSQRIGDDSIEASLRRAATTNIEKPKSVMPLELRFVVTAVFTSVQLAVLIVLIVLWVKAKPYGISLSILSPLLYKNQFVRQLLENYIPTAIATFIEPVWLVIARLIGLLQPFIELRRGPVPAKRSLTLEYNSLPPQLFILKALRARHFMLAALCSLVLLANILAIAFSGLFFENTIIIPKNYQFQPVYLDKFVPVNGTIGPQYKASEGEDPLRNGVESGAYSGGSGLDQFYILVSNLTAGTSLPAWTDEQYFYVPFESALNNTSDNTNITAQQLEATTTAFGAELTCTELTPGIGSGPNAYNLTITKKNNNNAANMTVTMQLADGTTVTCGIDNSHYTTNILNGPLLSSPSDCPRGPSALELILSPDVSSNTTTQSTHDFCSTLVLAVWARHDDTLCTRNHTDLTSALSTLALGCQPTLATGTATVTVNSAGHLQRTPSPFNTSTATAQHFTTGPRELFRQAHQYYINNQANNGEGTGRTWHNDTLASDFHNYLIAARNLSGVGRSLLDPRAAPPSARSAARAFAAAYAEIFAIWLGAHAERLLLPLNSSGDSTTVAIDGYLESWAYM